MHVNVLCFGNSTGSIDLSVTAGTAPYTYVWTASLGGAIPAGQANGQDLSSLHAGTYSVVVTDANGCTISRSIVITQPEMLTCNISNLLIAGCQANNGSAMVTPMGGTGPFTYLWDNGEITATAVLLGAGLHTVVVTDVNLCSTTCETTILSKPCDFCTYTQGFYGSQKGTACTLTGQVRGDIFVTGLLAQGDMRIGGPSYYILFKAGDASIIRNILPGGGGTGVLSGQCIPSVSLSCLSSYLTKQGRLNNGLLAQTITLGLNLRIGEGLSDLSLESGKWLTTQKKLDCSAGSGVVEMVCGDNGMSVNPYSYTMLPAGVLCFMSNNGYDMTVGGLFDLANDALGRVKTFPATVTCNGMTYSVKLTDILSAVDQINNAFDECRVFVGYRDDKFSCTKLSDPLITANVVNGKLSVYPNPFSDKVTFDFISDTDANALLEVYNVLGEKISVVMNRRVVKGAPMRIEYQPINLAPGIIYYRLNLDGNIQMGKLVYFKTY
jgi:hypothetical protein